MGANYFTTMGTNYYFSYKPLAIETEAIHIGKSSVGWCFALHVYPELGIDSLNDWIALFESNKADKFPYCKSYIVDEYDHEHTVEELLENITKRRNGNRRINDITAALLEQNHAILGPNGLLRHKIDDKHCVGHGEGTYDYMIGDFR